MKCPGQVCWADADPTHGECKTHPRVDLVTDVAGHAVPLLLRVRHCNLNQRRLHPQTHTHTQSHTSSHSNTSVTGTETTRGCVCAASAAAQWKQCGNGRFRGALRLTAAAHTHKTPEYARLPWLPGVYRILHRPMRGSDIYRIESGQTIRVAYCLTNALTHRTGVCCGFLPSKRRT